jgi:hypothetical protein
MLNIGGRPIANKYREGKMKRTLKRGLKVPEIAGREANETARIRKNDLKKVENESSLLMIDCRCHSNLSSFL